MQKKDFYDESDETLEQVAREVDAPFLQVLKARLDEAQPGLVEDVPASGWGLALDDL